MFFGNKILNFSIEKILPNILNKENILKKILTIILSYYLYKVFEPSTKLKEKYKIFKDRFDSSYWKYEQRIKIIYNKIIDNFEFKDEKFESEEKKKKD